MIFPIDEIAKLNLSNLLSFVSKKLSFTFFRFYSFNFEANWKKLRYDF